MGVVGALTASWLGVVQVSFYAMLAALCMAVWLMVRKGLIRRTASRVFSAVLLKAMRAKPAMQYDDSPQIPFALAIAVGAAVGGAEVLLKIRMPWSGYM